MIPLIAILVIVILWAFLYYSDRNGRYIDKTFPGPLRLPLIGNLYVGLCSRETMYKMYTKYPKAFNFKPIRLWTHENPKIIIFDHKNAKLILSSNIEQGKTREYYFLEPYIGKSVLTGAGEFVKKHRKLLTSAFHFQILPKFFKIFESNADIFCENLANHEGKEAFDASQYITLYTLDNICDSSMGIKIHAQRNPISDYVTAIKKMSDIILFRTLIPWLRSDWTYKCTQTYRLQKKLVKILHEHDYIVFEKKKGEFDCNQNLIDQGQEGVKEKSAFLDTMLAGAQEGGFSDQEILDGITSVMFAGHDTMTSSLSFLLYALAEHPDVQEKVYKEIETVCGQSDVCPTYNDLKLLKYTEQAIKESLRFYSVAPIIGRTFPVDFQLHDNQIVPKGTEVHIVIAAIHRDPEIWPNPSVFDPERFSPENCSTRPPFAFIPFSGGPRNCLGQKFAMAQLKITLWKLLRRFKLAVSDDPKHKVRPIAGMILQSRNGIMIKVRRRLRKNSED